MKKTAPKAHGFTSYDGLLELLNQRRQELGLSFAELDRRAGCADSYSSHLFIPENRHGRGMGTTSLPLIFGALGVKLVFDDAAAARYAPKEGAPLTKVQLMARRKKPSNDNDGG